MVRRLDQTADREVWALSWLPGQGTDLHDHGGSGAAFLVVAGALTEETVSGGRLRPHHLAAGSGRRFGPRDHERSPPAARARPYGSEHPRTPGPGPDGTGVDTFWTQCPEGSRRWDRTGAE
ncbi:hypothetical protein ACGF5C_04615 [Micromonospora sp. NPDC047620]|uniref:hypothetical protein n=1 Tax=Micromonospora sp. NPDC047620 TaxID=3364251 RepID=UPI00371AE8C9